jgi:predicted amidohydrolase
MKPSKLVIASAQMKFRPAIAENVSWIADAINSSAKGGADVILFPECAVTGYNRDFGAVSPTDVHAALKRIARAARAARCHVLVGTPTFVGGKRFNSLVVFDRQGRCVFCYSKIHLTARDTRFFSPELVRLPVMLGAQIVFHANAGLDSLAVSKSKRRGRDGIAVRAFENEVYYVFANSVGRQGGGHWSAGDSKIVAPDSQVLALANNRDETVIQAEVDLSRARRKYAREALQEPAFLRIHWKTMLAACRRQLGHRYTRLS